MIIECPTIRAAGQVLVSLLDAQLQPFHDFAITPMLSVALPITFTVTATLPIEQLSRLRAAISTVAEAHILD